MTDHDQPQFIPSEHMRANPPEDSERAIYAIYLPRSVSRVAVFGERTPGFRRMAPSRIVRGYALMLRGIWRDLAELHANVTPRFDGLRATSIVMWKTWARVAGPGVPFCLFCGSTEFLPDISASAICCTNCGALHDPETAAAADLAIEEGGDDGGPKRGR